MVNGQASGVRELEQAGLPQGSPLLPILFLFFNADLMQQRIDQNGGAIAFVDEYTAWVVGKTATENKYRLQAIVQQATEWESRNGASFEGDKTAFIHFTRNSGQSAQMALDIYSTVSMSDAPERAFSGTETLLTPRRRNMTGEGVEQMKC